MTPDTPLHPDTKASIPPLPRGETNENPPDIGFWALLREDFQTHDRMLSEPGLWAIWAHRFGNWRMGVRFRLLRIPLTLLYRIVKTWVHWVWGIKLDYVVKVGRRVRIWHHGGMVLGARSIGNDVHIRQNTTFGVKNRREVHGKPMIGDRVEIGCGAVILGHIHVGHDSVIGANTVVTRDVPPYSVVVGVPGVIVKTLAPAPTDDPAEDGDGRGSPS